MMKEVKKYAKKLVQEWSQENFDKVKADYKNAIVNAFRNRENHNKLLEHVLEVGKYQGITDDRRKILGLVMEVATNEACKSKIINNGEKKRMLQQIKNQSIDLFEGRDADGTENYRIHLPNDKKGTTSESLGDNSDGGYGRSSGEYDASREETQNYPSSSKHKPKYNQTIPTSIPRATFQQAQEWAKKSGRKCTLIGEEEEAFSFSGQSKDKKQIRFEFHNGKDGDPATLKLEKNAPFETYEKMASFAQANKGKILDVSQLEGKDKILAFIAAKQKGLEVRGVTPEEIHRHQKAALKAIGPNHSGYAKAETLLKKELAKKSPEEVVRVKSPSPGGQN